MQKGLLLEVIYELLHAFLSKKGLGGRLSFLEVSKSSLLPAVLAKKKEHMHAMRCNKLDV